MAVTTLNRKLLALLLPALVTLLCGQLWLSYRGLQVAADSAYDRSLAGAIKAIDANISTASGGLGVELPYRTLEFFHLTANGKVFYRVSTEDGLVTLGNADLPGPLVGLQSDVPHFYDAQYFGEPVRIGAYARRLDLPLYGSHAQRVIIQVAETIESRTAFTRGLLTQAVLLDVLLVLVIALAMAASVVLALRPLQRLRNEVMARAQDDLTPIDPSSVPLEVRPLVDAVNHHVARSSRMARSQRQFLDDASHQLRTPLAVLRTQIDYALREHEVTKVHEAVDAMQRAVERSVRLINQLLALARVNNSATPDAVPEKINLCNLVEEVARMLLPEARRKRQDFGVAVATESIFVLGSETLLREAMANLVDNAIRHVPAGGHITLSVERDDMAARISVVDNGPGIPAEERARIGERFRRGKNAAAGGAGLGLAIAKTIAEQHGGRLEVADGPQQSGVTMRLIFPLWFENNQPPYRRNE